MSSRLTTALLGSAIVAGSVSGVAFAQDPTTTIKPCIGELCPPKSPRGDMPEQSIEDTNQAEQMQDREQSPGQVTPRKKIQAGNKKQPSSGQVTPRNKIQAGNKKQPSSVQVTPRKKKLASNKKQPSSGQVTPRKKKLASNRQQQPSKGFWDWLF